MLVPIWDHVPGKLMQQSFADSRQRHFKTSPQRTYALFSQVQRVLTGKGGLADTRFARQHSHFVTAKTFYNFIQIFESFPLNGCFVLFSNEKAYLNAL